MWERQASRSISLYLSWLCPPREWDWLSGYWPDGCRSFTATQDESQRREGPFWNEESVLRSAVVVFSSSWPGLGRFHSSRPAGTWFLWLAQPVLPSARKQWSQNNERCTAHHRFSWLGPTSPCSLSFTPSFPLHLKEPSLCPWIYLHGCMCCTCCSWGGLCPHFYTFSSC